MKRLLLAIGRLLNPAPFRVGELVEFRPDERAMGWTQDPQGLHPGYVGTVTGLVRGRGLEWDVYLDGKTVGFLSVYFRRVSRPSEARSGGR